MPRKIRAIIVDDEARLRRGVERLVLSNEEEWEVAGSFSSGDECLTAIQEEEIPFDLLITDVKMPGIDGLTLIKRLKELSAFHAMVISGFDDFQFLQTAIREGASDYMIKPIDRDDFKSQLRKIKEKIHAEWNNSLRLEEIESKASQFTHVKQTQMLSEVTWKQDIDLSLLEWTKDFPNGEYVLMYVGLDNLLSKSKAFEKDDWNAWTFAIENMYEEMRGNLVRSSIHSWRWKGEDLSFWLLLHAQEGKGDLSIDDGGFQFADELRLNIQRYTPFTCSIAVSRKINDLALLPSLKDELLTYIQFRLLYGGNRIFSSEAINQLKMNKKGMDSKEAEHQINRIIYSLDSRNPEKTKNEIMGFLNRIQSLSSPEEIEHSLHLLGIQIINYMIKNNQGRADFPLMKEVFGLTKKMANLIELRNEVYEWVKKVLAIMEQKSETQNADPIEVAKRWIQDHLDQNITIQKIASEVYLNPTYFCEYFKSQTGETVLDYVTRIRMEKARMLLVSSNFKIYAISEMVGYTDTKYFTKLFKKQYGETPSKYKESILFEQH